MTALHRLAAVFFLCLLLPLLGTMALAEEKRQPFQAPSTPGAVSQPKPGGENAGIATQAWNWLLTQQSKLNREMAAAVKELKNGDGARGAMLLIGIAFFYGVLHAAGPGHGKAIISSYVLANEETVRRGIALSFLAALFQALSAIVFVGILAIALNQTSLQMRNTEATIETLSWGLVAAVGAYLLYRQFASLKLQPATAPAHEHKTHHHHDHAHGKDCSCGHSHMPSPKDLQGAWSWKKALPLAISVGIRPCSGALLLLIFALSQGILWAGILGTFAMALGTAITVSVLAAMAVSSRNWAERMSGEGSPWAARIHTAAGFAGAALVFLMGAAFFVASLNGPAPL